MRRRVYDLASKRVLLDPKNYVQDRHIALDHMSDRLISAQERLIASEHRRFASYAASLDALSPLKVLGRGYCIAKRDDGSVVKCAADVKNGDKITLRLQSDEVRCRVEE
jgi:exodeoxyribonuclease VII large subunit